MATELKALIAATEAVGDAITAGHWEEAAQLEAKRRDSLRSYVQEQLEQDVDPSHLAAALQDLNQRTYQLKGEADHYQRKIIREAFVARTGEQAVATYARNSAKP